MKAFEVFGLAAEQLDSPTLVAGRHSFQSEAEKQIVQDVRRKLGLDHTHRLLEIGCGVGNLLTPLSETIAQGVGVDHPKCIARYRALGVPANVFLVEGEWPDARPDGTFDRVLVYSVLHYLPGAEAARAFIRRCLQGLRPGGAVLLGDIPNDDKRRRFLHSSRGRQFHEQYVAQRASAKASHVSRDKIFDLMDSSPAPYWTDALVLQLIAELRQQGYESYLLPQPAGLPFSFTREDLVIWGHQ